MLTQEKGCGTKDLFRGQGTEHVVRINSLDKNL